MYKYMVLALTLMLLVSNIDRVSVSADELRPIIYLDPGHGGKDGGADYEDTFEDEIALNISLFLKDKLESIGYLVYLTRCRPGFGADTRRKRSGE